MAPQKKRIRAPIQIVTFLDDSRDAALKRAMDWLSKAIAQASIDLVGVTSAQASAEAFAFSIIFTPKRSENAGGCCVPG